MNLLHSLRQATAPLLSLFILELGSGFFPTLVSLELSQSHYSSVVIGVVSAAFYCGLLVGSFRVEPIISRFGHIRAFAAFASSLTGIYVLHGIFGNVWLWVILRFLGGVMTAGAFVVIESWLLCVSTTTTRGQILSLYMISFYASQALGQLMLNIRSSDHLLPYTLVAVLCSLSVIPLSMTRVMLPEFGEPEVMRFRSLYQKVASGLIGAFCAGLILGCLYTMLPVVLHHMGLANASISLYMSVMIFGGMLLQYPIGRLSDVVERRVVLIFVCLLTFAVSLLIMMNLKPSVFLISLFFTLGGLTFTIYPVSVSYACDALSATQIVAATQALLMAYSVGAMLGPVSGSVIMFWSTKQGSLLFTGIISVMLMIFLMYRKTQTVSMPQEEPFRSVPQTTPVATELDPRLEEEAETISEDPPLADTVAKQ